MSNEYFALDANVAALAQAFGEDMGDVKRRILKDATTFPTRTEMVSALPSLADSPDGRIVFANGEGYMRDRDSSAIPDMPGWKRWEPIPGVVNASDIVSYGEQSPNPAKQAQARQNLGLGTASTHGEDDFATAEQGERADTAVSYEEQEPSELERTKARKNLGLGTAALADVDDFPIKSFASRADLLAANPQVSDGSTVSDGVVTYVRKSSSVAIPDFQGWEPFGVVQPEHFGAPTGTTEDSTPSFQAALDWCGNHPGRKLEDKYDGTRFFNSSIVLEDKHVRWDAGVAKYFKTNNTRLLAARVTPKAVLSLTEDYVPGSTTLKVDGLTEPLREGDWVRVVSNAVNPFARGNNTPESAYRVREVARVVGGSGNEIELGAPLRFVEGVDISDNSIVPAITVGNGVRVVVYNTEPVFEFTGGCISYEEERDWNSEVFRITGYYRPKLNEFKVDVAYGPVIANVGCLFMDARDFEVGRVDDDSGLGQYGYPINDGGFRTTVTDYKVFRARNAYTTQNSKSGLNFTTVDSHYLGGNIVGANIVRGKGYNCLSTTFNTHHEAFDITFVDTYAEGGQGAAYIARGFVKYVRPVGRMVRDAVSSSTEYVSGDYLAGKDRKFASHVEVFDADIEGTGYAFRSYLSTLTLHGNCRFKTSMRQAVVCSGDIHVRGNVSLDISSNYGATPIGGTNQGNCIEVRKVTVPESEDYFTGSKFILYPNSTLEVSTAEANFSFGIIGTSDQYSEFILDGFLRLNMADSQIMFAVDTNIRGSNYASGALVIDAPDTGTINSFQRSGRGFGIFFEGDVERAFPISADYGLAAGAEQSQTNWPNDSIDDVSGVRHGAFYSATTGAGWPELGTVLYIKRNNNANATQVLFHAGGISMRTATNATDKENPNWTSWTLLS